MANTFKSRGLVLPNSSTSSNVYVCPANTTSIILMCQASNKTANVYPITVQWVDSSAASTTYKLLNTVQIPVNASLGCLDGKLILESGDYLQAFSNTANSVELSISILEIT